MGKQRFEEKESKQNKTKQTEKTTPPKQRHNNLGVREKGASWVPLLGRSLGSRLFQAS